MRSVLGSVVLVKFVYSGRNDLNKNKNARLKYINKNKEKGFRVISGAIKVRTIAGS